MKRHELVRPLRRHGCDLLRESSRHSVYRSVGTGRQATVPRHTEIANNLVRKICHGLSTPSP